MVDGGLRVLHLQQGEGTGHVRGGERGARPLEHRAPGDVHAVERAVALAAPGATRSIVGPRLPKSAIWSSRSEAPTAMALDTQAGSPRLPVWASLPVATVVAIPSPSSRWIAARNATASGSAPCPYVAVRRKGRAAGQRQVGGRDVHARVGQVGDVVEGEQDVDEVGALPAGVEHLDRVHPRVGCHAGRGLVAGGHGGHGAAVRAALRHGRCAARPARRRVEHLPTVAEVEVEAEAVERLADVAAWTAVARPAHRRAAWRRSRLVRRGCLRSRTRRRCRSPRSPSPRRDGRAPRTTVPRPWGPSAPAQERPTGRASRHGRGHRLRARSARRRTARGPRCRPR